MIGHLIIRKTWWWCIW